MLNMFSCHFKTFITFDKLTRKVQGTEHILYIKNNFHHLNKNIIVQILILQILT